MTTITAAPLWPFLQERNITQEQAEAVETALYLVGNELAQGAMILLPAEVVHEALTEIDAFPWKDTSAVEFREYLQAELKATGIRYWITGAESLALEASDLPEVNSRK